MTPTRTPWHMDHDWYDGLVPGNVRMADDVFLLSAYTLGMFHSERDPGLSFGRASGTYDQAAFIVGPLGCIDIDEFACINSATLICNDRIAIGPHCLIAWGVVITDTWLTADTPIAARRKMMQSIAADPLRRMPSVNEPKPVTLEANVWVGFGAVIMPGVTLGRGCVIGCKTVICADVPPYAVVVGSPPRIIRQLNPDDTDEARSASMARYLQT